MSPRIMLAAYLAIFAAAFGLVALLTGCDDGTQRHVSVQCPPVSSVACGPLVSGRYRLTCSLESDGAHTSIETDFPPQVGKKFCAQWKGR